MILILELKSSPILYLDFSNKQIEESAINTLKIQELTKKLIEIQKKNKDLEENNILLNEEVIKYF